MIGTSLPGAPDALAVILRTGAIPTTPFRVHHNITFVLHAVRQKFTRIFVADLAALAAPHSPQKRRSLREQSSKLNFSVGARNKTTCHRRHAPVRRSCVSCASNPS